MNSISIVSELKKAFEVHFIQEALFELMEDKQNYSPLLVVNHQDEFLTLSNEDFYLIVLPIGSNHILQRVEEHAGYVFNRKKIFIHLVNQKGTIGLKGYNQLSISEIIKKSEYNSIDNNNIFLKLFQDIQDLQNQQI